ncbi:MAG: U32 family peptidase [Candidatus Wukongarchaeota archaeon]|nr:peptidase U32 family protein [Candidatus Wukongarchaeota archaeon]
MVKECEITIGTSWSFDFLEKLSVLNKMLGKKNNTRIAEVYGSIPNDVLGTARARERLHDVNREILRKHVEKAHEHDIEVAYANNTSCIGRVKDFDEKFETIIKHFEELYSMEVDSLIIAIPLLIEIVKKHFPDMKIIVSTIAEVNSIKKAKYYHDLGANTIVLSFNENRNFKLIENIKKSFPRLKLGVLVTEPCIYECHLRQSHFTTQSHESLKKASPLKNSFVCNWPFDRCWKILTKNWPSEFLKSRWIRPEDIVYYETFNVERFKITGRTMPENWLLNTAKAYLNRRYEGNLLDILPVIPGDYRKEGQVTGYKLDNRLLDGFIKKFIKDGHKCKHKCMIQCQYCEKYAEKIRKIKAKPDLKIIEKPPKARV